MKYRRKGRRRAAALLLVLFLVVTGVVVGSILFAQNPFKPEAPVYQLDIGVNHGVIGSVTVSGDYYNNINSPWFNLTLLGGRNYLVQFPYFVQYAGTVSKSFPVYLAYNVSEVFVKESIWTIAITGAPAGTGYYQQLFNITNYASYGISSPPDNFELQLPNGTLEYAWIQSYDSHNLTVWVKLPNATASVNLVVYPGQDLLSASGYIGEAPQLSTTYGQYDNGFSVFNFYDNFAGTTLDTSKWSNVGSNGTSGSLSSITVDNGLTLVANGTEIYQHETWIWAKSTISAQFSGPLVVDVMENSTSSVSVFRWGETNSAPTDFAAAGQDYFGEQAYRDGHWYSDANNGSSVYNQNEWGLYMTDQYTLWSISATNSKVLYYDQGSYTSLSGGAQTTTAYVPQYSSSISLMLSNDVPTPIYVRWVNVRTYLPSGMPTYTISAASSAVALNSTAHTVDSAPALPATAPVLPAGPAMAAPDRREDANAA